ncbi:MAG TPA: hypothetical protein VK586_28195, partial [Streptosporangiaceae bacterium]|nr:hypothetical protein [Streptosporangiaceae bacterium]
PYPPGNGHYPPGNGHYPAGNGHYPAGNGHGYLPGPEPLAPAPAPAPAPPASRRRDARRGDGPPPGAFRSHRSSRSPGRHAAPAEPPSDPGDAR